MSNSPAVLAAQAWDGEEGGRRTLAHRWEVIPLGVRRAFEQERSRRKEGVNEAHRVAIWMQDWSEERLQPGSWT